jgi:hypothetical protein
MADGLDIGQSKKYITLLIRIPQGDNQLKKEKLFEEFLVTLHKTLKNRKISMELISYRQHIYFYFYVPHDLLDLVEGQLYARYPDCEIEHVPDYVDERILEKSHIVGTEMRFSRSDIYPIKTYPEFEGDSLSSVFSVLSKAEKQDQAWIQVVMSPLQDTWSFNLARSIKLRLRGFKNMLRLKNYVKGSNEVSKKEKEAIMKKTHKDYFAINIKIGYLSDNLETSLRRLKALAEAFSQFNTIDFNEIQFTGVSKGKTFLQRYKLRSKVTNFHVNTEELSSLYHFPNPDLVPHIVHVMARRAEPPLDLPIRGKDGEISFFGITNFHNQNNVFGIKRDDRRRHLYVVGKSGVGKSKLLELLVREDILHGHGVAVLDPHGDLIDAVIRQIPESRVKDVVYFDPSDVDFPLAFNPLEKVAPEYKMRVTIGFIEIFKKLFGANWTPRLEHVLRYITLALLDSPNTTMLSILKMLSDKNYRQKIVAHIDDSVVKNFWVNEFAAWSEKFDNEAIMPVLNKVGQFVSTSLIRNIVGQPENRLDIRKIMDEQKILLVKLSRGLLGEENSNLLGAMLITKIQQAAMSRADIKEEQRKDFYLYIDEFQNFATDTFEQILSEARKYHLAVTLAHQFMGQLSASIRATVFGNVGSIVSFRVGAEDAVVLEKEYTPVFKVRDIINLGVREFYIKMSIDGEMRDAFSGRTMTLEFPKVDYSQQIIEYSRKMYAKPRAVVEKELAAWNEGTTTANGPGEGQDEDFAKPVV